MPDRFGKAELPATAPFGDPKTNAVGDPFLNVLVAYLQAVINAETKAAWQVICPPRRRGETTVDVLPVLTTETHNPDNEVFVEHKLPALYAWRGDTLPTRAMITQGWEVVDTPINVLWVPPPTVQEKARIREPFRNLIDKAIRKAFRRGRHPAWVVPGDTYFDAQTRGSIFIRHAGVMRVEVGPFRSFPLTIENEDSKGTPFYALNCTLTIREMLRDGYDGYVPLSHVEGRFLTNSPGLEIDAFRFRPTLTSVTPSSGPVAGGTTIVLVGHQFRDDGQGGLKVRVGSSECPTVTLVDESTIMATTPPGALGAQQSVTVTRPSGDSATLPAAFTYV